MKEGSKMTDRFKIRVWSDGDEEPQIVSIDDLIGWFHELHPGSYCTVEQCTGPKDKNDKLIFEGDILRSPKMVNNKPVHWNGRWWQVGTSQVILCDMEVEYYQFEVIGNIHENPELLEQQ